MEELQAPELLPEFVSWDCLVEKLCSHSSLPPPPPPFSLNPQEEEEERGHVRGPVLAGRNPVVTGFSACLIELPVACNVWKFKTDVHIISLWFLPVFLQPSLLVLTRF